MSFYSFSSGYCIICPFILSPLAIVLYVPLRVTTSDYPIVMFQLFFVYVNYIVYISGDFPDIVTM